MKSIQILPLYASISIARASSSWIATPAAAFVSPASARHQTLHRMSSSSSSSSLSFSTVDDMPPDVARFNNLIYATDDTVRLLRDELKVRLLKAADDYREMREASDATVATDTPDEEVDDDHRRGYYAMRLLRGIARKISRRKTTKKEEDDGAADRSSRRGGVLSSDSLRQSRLDVGATGNRVVEIAEQLSLLNPTPIPTSGFKSYGGAPPSESKLGGSWKLRFTTAADASFPTTEKRGVVSTSQVVDATEGTLTNVIDFEKGRLTGFRVVVGGEPASGTDIGLTFRSVEILRRSRFPRLFGRVTIRLPSRLIRWFASRNNKVGEEEEEEQRRGMVGPYLRLRYVDDNLRMHTTDSGNWFVQTRIQ